MLPGCGAGHVDVGILALRGGCGAGLGLALLGGLGRLGLGLLVVLLLLGLLVVGLGLVVAGFHGVKDGGRLGEYLVCGQVFADFLASFLAGLALLGGCLNGGLDDLHDALVEGGVVLLGQVFLLVAEALLDGLLDHFLEVVCAHLHRLRAGDALFVHVVVLLIRT